MAIQDDNNVSHDEENNDWMSKLLHSHIFKNIPFQEIQKIFLLFEQIDVAKNDKIKKSLPVPRRYPHRSLRGNLTLTIYRGETTIYRHKNGNPRA